MGDRNDGSSEGDGRARAVARSDLNQVLTSTPVLTSGPTVLIIKTADAEHRYIPADGP